MSCLTSHATRVVARPVFGGVDIHVEGDLARAQVRRDMNSAHRVRDPDGAGQRPRTDEGVAESSALRRAGSACCLLPSKCVTSVPSRRPSCRLAYRSSASKRAATSRRAWIVAAQGAGGDRLPGADPGAAHVIEGQRAGSGVLEVPDQLTEDPRLVGVGDAPVLLLVTASASTWLQERWCSATLRSFRLSTVVGC